jgi:predicted RNA-binding protein Jag
MWEAVMGWACGYDGETVNAYRILVRKSFGRQRRGKVRINTELKRYRL